MVKAIVGANWGDEGKGKITDMLAEESDIVVRFQGGSNAGHTIINDYGKFALHLLPSGVFYNHITSVIGNGVALNIPYLINEIKSITDRNVPMPKILVSDRAQIMMPYHIDFDTYEEARLAGKSFGSTKSGIAPFYSDKYAKIGFQVSELFGDEEALKEKIANVCTLKNVMLEHLYHKPLLKEEDIFNTLMEYKEMVKPFVCDTSAFLHQALKDGKKILLEGQLGSLKDPDHGIYPMVTSSSTLAPYGAIGAGIPAASIQDVVTVVKAYSSAVGAGAFVSEIFGDEAKKKNIALHYTINVEHEHILTDTTKVKEILVNILSNAVKFTPDGGTITFEAQCQEKGGDGYINMRYRISDTGIGMSEEFTKEVFEEFAQEDSDVRTQYHGAGLGMAIVKKYVDMMGGTISVQSKKHEGISQTQVFRKR